ncbi:MAG: aminotransferase class I/II-fold pyridoxal phosphate-dependent enzyme [Clostridia bacterium]|nr:aminotransferase class I/II-fold pyridoxal phosphate-dependent enzyme [Clostridia bacterium]
MQAIILAAGMGSRLKSLTQYNTKCMVKVNGVGLIDRMMSQLDNLGLEKIIVVVGYRGQQLIDYIEDLGISTKVEYVDNPVYDKTNNIYSLALAKDYMLEDDTLLLESDLIFEDSVLQKLVDDPRDTLAVVDKYESWMDGTVVKLNESDDIVQFIPGKKFDFKDADEVFKTVNIYKFGKEFSVTHYVPFLDAYQSALGLNEYYEAVLGMITMLDESTIKGMRLDGDLWYEVDDLQDLDIASVLFTPEKEKKGQLLRRRYGGYWRYPKMLDFCYLNHPHFPNQKLLEEIKANVEKLVTSYPSGMTINTLLASKLYDIKQEQIVIGNGASELIKSLMEKIDGKLGFINPSFEEYLKRYQEKEHVVFKPEEEGFRYSADDLIEFFNENAVDGLVICNPDYPTGNYIPKADMIKLLDWAKGKNIRLILDDTFSVYADEEDNLLLDHDVIAEYPNLIIIRSISKAHGVPGLRLGILASSDEKLIVDIKNDVAIWNINSIAECYMQIVGKYKKAYKAAMQTFHETKDEFIGDLQKISGIKVYETQGNFVMVEILYGKLARDITNELLEEYKIFVKDLSHKHMYDKREFISVAIKKPEENKALVAALKTIMGE